MRKNLLYMALICLTPAIGKANPTPPTSDHHSVTLSSILSNEPASEENNLTPENTLITEPALLSQEEIHQLLHFAP